MTGGAAPLSLAAAAGAGLRPFRLRLPGSAAETAAIAGILSCLMFQLHLVFRQEVNWDEFYFLSFLHDHGRGALTKPLQTFHVHLFGWVRWAGGNEMRQIEAARLALLLLEAGTAGCIFLTARRFFAPGEALLAALFYLSFPYVLLHGASFRADPIAAFLLMLALAFLVRSRLAPAALLAVAAAVAVAGLVTVKAVFWLPALAGAALWRLRESGWNRRLALRLAACGAGAAALFALLFLAHASALPLAPPGASEAMVSSALSKTILETQAFPRSETILRGLLLGPVHHLLLLFGALAALAALRRGAPARAPLLLVAAMALPLASFAFYRNAFPYYYGFILPPACLLVAVGARRLRNRPLLLALLAALMAATAAWTYAQALERERTAQEETIAVVHRLFPEPVPYIDRNAMIAGFAKAGFFMSSWGIEAYRAAGRPLFEEILAAEAPVFVLANGLPLRDALRGERTAPAAQQLLPEDQAALRQNYVPHWGALWVAGKAFEAGPRPGAFDLRIAGRYTLEAGAAVTIGGKRIAPGSVVRLPAGRHGVTAPVPTRAVLRWGAHLPRPAAPPSPSPIYWGF